MISDLNFGIVVIGPGGSGKSTFCKQVSSFYDSIERNNVIVNIDSGNESDFQYHIDIKQLIQSDEIQKLFKLGFVKQSKRRCSIRV